MSSITAKKRSNLRDVAARAQVSVATVSRVLNAPEKVSPTTRNRVETAIAELKFVPSAAARAINRGRSGVVAALFPTLDNAIYARVVNGLEQRLAHNDLSLVVAQTNDDRDAELERAKQMINVGADALIVVGLSQRPEFFDLVERAQIPVVAISCFDRQNTLPTIGYDNAAASLLAAKYLVDLGHRNVAVLHGNTDANDRMRIRKDALRAASFDWEVAYLEVPISAEGGYLAAEALMSRDSRPTGILCFSDVIAHGALSRLHSLGIRVPQDVSVLGMEDLPVSQFTSPPLTSVSLSVADMGEKAADAISSWLDTDIRPEPLNLDVSVVVRSSVARVAR